VTPEEEAQAKAEHEADKYSCIWPYPEHDYETTYEDDEIWQGVCSRCGAQAEEMKKS